MSGTKVIVKSGDCTLSIAAEHGVPWEKIWQAPENNRLREQRAEPNLLMSGDVVFVPDPELREESCSTETRHRFVRKLLFTEVRIKLEDCGEPRANEPYYAEIGDRRIDGETTVTDEQGLAIVKVPASAKRVILVVGEEEDEYELLVGELDPPDSVSGKHGMLSNLGFDTGGVGTDYDERSATAMSEFLRAQSVEADTHPENSRDEASQKALKEAYESK